MGDYKAPERGEADASCFRFSEEALRKAVTPKTKLILLNTLHNPTGKVFTQKELELIAQIVKESGDRAIVVTDEVYEWLVYDEKTPFPRMCNVEGMWDRTLTISSAGKTFSATGWKVGWICGPAKLINPCSRAH